MAPSPYETIALSPVSAEKATKNGKNRELSAVIPINFDDSSCSDKVESANTTSTRCSLPCGAVNRVGKQSSDPVKHQLPVLTLEKPVRPCPGLAAWDTECKVHSVQNAPVTLSREFNGQESIDFEPVLSIKELKRQELEILRSGYFTREIKRQKSDDLSVSLSSTRDIEGQQSHDLVSAPATGELKLQAADDLPLPLKTIPEIERQKSDDLSVSVSSTRNIEEQQSDDLVSGSMTGEFKLEGSSDLPLPLKTVPETKHKKSDDLSVSVSSTRNIEEQQSDDLAPVSMTEEVKRQESHDVPLSSEKVPETDRQKSDDASFALTQELSRQASRGVMTVPFTGELKYRGKIFVSAPVTQEIKRKRLDYITATLEKRLKEDIKFPSLTRKNEQQEPSDHQSVLYDSLDNSLSAKDEKLFMQHLRRIQKVYKDNAQSTKKPVKVYHASSLYGETIIEKSPEDNCASPVAEEFKENTLETRAQRSSPEADTKNALVKCLRKRKIISYTTCKCHES